MASRNAQIGMADVYAVLAARLSTPSTEHGDPIIAEAICAVLLNNRMSKVNLLAILQQHADPAVSDHSDRQEVAFWHLERLGVIKFTRRSRVQWNDSAWRQYEGLFGLRRAPLKA